MLGCFFEKIEKSLRNLQKNLKENIAEIVQVNFSASVHICSKFLLKNIPSSAIEALIPRFFVPIQHTVSSERNKLLNLL